MQNNTVFIKAEANEIVGKGHLHRSISLANELTSLGVKVEFVFAETKQEIISSVKKNFTVHKIKKKEQYSFDSYSKFINKNSIILFDTDDIKFYSGALINNFKNKEIKTACFTITDKYPIYTDILINTNIVSLTHKYITKKNTIKLLGPQYLIFNSVFREISQFTSASKKEKNLLLFFGNADNNMLTEHFIKTISLIETDFNKINIIIGGLNERINEILKEVKTLSKNKTEFFFNISPKQMIEVYKSCNIAITSAGMSMWEMALFNISQIVIASSEREIEYTNYLNNNNFIFKLCNFNNLPPVFENSKKIKNIIVNEIENLMVKEFNKIINPQGIKKIATTFKEQLSK